MCNIIVLEPGQMPVESDLYNMCYNNWHSYGLVTVVDNKLDIKRVVPKSGEVDPKEVYELLLKDRQYTRYLHVRHNTVGATSIENTHPFDVYCSNTRQVVFMHNGTLYEYKPSTGVSSWKGNTYHSSSFNDNNEGDSDTKKFTEDVLQKIAPVIKGDFTSEAMLLVLRKFWPASGNRGLIITNDLSPVYLGEWKTRKDSNGVDYKSANDDYFDAVTRGPQKSRIEAQKKKEEEEQKKSQQSTVVNINRGTSFRRENGDVLQLPANWPTNWPEYTSVFHLKKKATGLIDEIDFWERPNSVSVAALTNKELEDIQQEPESCIALMSHVFADYGAMYEELCALRGKHDAASKIIAQLKNQISVLETSGRTIN